MATVNFILHRAYKKDISNDNRQGHQSEKLSVKPSKIIKKKKLVDSDVRLYAVLIFPMFDEGKIKSKVVKIKTKYKVKPADWDFDKQRKKGPGVIELNKELNELHDRILNKYEATVKVHPDLNFSAIYTIMMDFGKKEEVPSLNHEKSLFDYLDMYIEFLKGEVTFRTAQKYTTLKKSLIAFGSESKNSKYKNLAFSMIDHQFMDSYRKYLRNQKPRGRMKSRPENFQNGILIDTEGKYVECIKTFCSWSEERGFNKYGVYKQFKNFSDANRKRRKPKNEIIALTLHELRQLYNYDLSDNPGLDKIRDLFCFEAYTGQRWSDIDKFERSEVTKDIWHFTTYKTKKQTRIDLIGYSAPALDILLKYDYNLPKVSLPHLNEKIKEVARLAKINAPFTIKRYVGAEEVAITKPKCEFISSHSARRTCLTLLLNEFNVPVTHVLQISGHSDLKTLMNYIAKDDKSRREFMSKTVPVTEIQLKVAK